MDLNLTGTGVLAVGAIVAVGAAVAYYLLFPTQVNDAVQNVLNTNPLTEYAATQSAQASVAALSGNSSFLTAPVTYNPTTSSIESQVTSNPSQSQIYINTNSQTGATESIGTYTALPANIYALNQSGAAGSINAPYYIGNGWQGAGYYGTNPNGSGVIKLFTSQLNFILGISS